MYAPLLYVKIAVYKRIHYLLIFALNYRLSVRVRNQCQLLKGAECHIYLYCFTFVYIDLNWAFVIIV